MDVQIAASQYTVTHLTAYDPELMILDAGYL